MCPQFLADPDLAAFHAHEWGEPVTEPIILFEYLVLHTFMAALPPEWVLRRREGFREALHDFNPGWLARLDEDDVAEFLGNPRVIRNRRKLETTRQNAQAWRRLQAELGGSEAAVLHFFYDFVGGRPLVNYWATAAEVPATTPAAERLARELKRRGFAGLGPRTCYQLLQTAGLVNDHLTGCPRHASGRIAGAAGRLSTHPVLSTP